MGRNSCRLRASPTSRFSPYPLSRLNIATRSNRHPNSCRFMPFGATSRWPPRATRRGRMACSRPGLRASLSRPSACHTCRISPPARPRRSPPIRRWSTARSRPRPGRRQVHLCSAARCPSRSPRGAARSRCWVTAAIRIFGGLFALLPTIVLVLMVLHILLPGWARRSTSDRTITPCLSADSRGDRHPTGPRRRHPPARHDGSAGMRRVHQDRAS